MKAKQHPAFFRGATPRNIAHRGLALDGAENTIRAFRDALAAGADIIETDTRATKDDIALACHDAELLRVAKDPRSVRNHNFSELTDVRVAGCEPLAKLYDAFIKFPDTPFNIDVKDATAIPGLVDAIELAGAANRVCITSFSDITAFKAVRAIKKATGIDVVRSPSLRKMVLFKLGVSLGIPLKILAKLMRNYACVQVPHKQGIIPVVTKRFIATAHQLGLEVHVWTIDDKAEMKKLLDMGVDGIITNRAHLLEHILQASGRQ